MFIYQELRKDFFCCLQLHNYTFSHKRGKVEIKKPTTSKQQYECLCNAIRVNCIDAVMVAFFLLTPPSGASWGYTKSLLVLDTHFGMQMIRQDQFMDKSDHKSATLSRSPRQKVGGPK